MDLFATLYKQVEGDGWDAVGAKPRMPFDGVLGPPLPPLHNFKKTLKIKKNGCTPW